MNFCDFDGLAICNSFFKHKWVHRYTYVNDSLDSRSIIDYMIVEQDRRKEVPDTRVFRGFAFGSDHFFVGSRLSVGALETRRRKRVVVKRFRIEKFKDELVKALFADRFAEKVESLPSQCENRGRMEEF